MFLTVLAGSVVAQTGRPALTVDVAVARALTNNPRLSSALRAVAAARFGLMSARALVNPDLTFTPGLQVGGSDTELLLRQPLELNGTRAARAGIAEAQLRGTQMQAIVETRTLIFDVKTAYYELLRSRDLQAVAAEEVQTDEEFDRSIRRLVEAGTRPGIEMVQTGIEITRGRQRLTLAESQTASAAAALNTLMALPVGSPVGDLPPPVSAPLVLDEEALIRNALIARAEISVQQALVNGFLQEARLARAEGVPDLAPQFRATRLTRGLHDYGLGIGVNLPLLDYGSRRNRVRQAEEAARAQEDSAEAQRNQVRAEVHQSVLRLRTTWVILQGYKQGILERARQILQASRISLQEGQSGVTLLSVLEARRTYRAVQTEYIDAQAAYAQAEAQLEHATGAIPESVQVQVRK